jgi:hypothetical protein
MIETRLQVQDELYLQRSTKNKNQYRIYFHGFVIRKSAKTGSKNRRRPRPLFLSKILLSKLSAYFKGISKAQRANTGASRRSRVC